MPRGGAIGERFITDEEWKEAVKLRLEFLQWSNVELARRLGVTPSAITNLFKKSRTSTLKPKIEELIGFPDRSAMPSPPSQFATGSRRPRAPEPEPLPEPLPAANREEMASEQLAELILHFSALDGEGRVRLIERAHTLRDERKK